MEEPVVNRAVAPLGFLEKIQLLYKLKNFVCLDKVNYNVQDYKNKIVELLRLMNHPHFRDKVILILDLNHLNDFNAFLNDIVYPELPEVQLEYEHCLHDLNNIIDKLLSNSQDPLLKPFQLYLKFSKLLNRGDIGTILHNVPSDLLSTLVFNRLFRHVNEKFGTNIPLFTNNNNEIHYRTIYNLISTLDPPVFNYFDEMLDVLSQDSPQGSYVLK
jgi:hypothetical protein